MLLSLGKLQRLVVSLFLCMYLFFNMHIVWGFFCLSVTVSDFFLKKYLISDAEVFENQLPQRRKNPVLVCQCRTTLIFFKFTDVLVICVFLDVQCLSSLQFKNAIKSFQQSSRTCVFNKLRITSLVKSFFILSESSICSFIIQTFAASLVFSWWN